MNLIIFCLLKKNRHKSLFQEHERLPNNNFWKHFFQEKKLGVVTEALSFSGTKNRELRMWKLELQELHENTPQLASSLCVVKKMVSKPNLWVDCKTHNNNQNSSFYPKVKMVKPFKRLLKHVLENRNFQKVTRTSVE